MTTTEYGAEQLLQDKQSEIRAAKEAIAGPVPLIEDAPDPVLTLPRGLSRSGIWEREVTCRELTGIDEEKLSRLQSPYAFFNTVLALGVVSVGPLDLTPLTVAERQFYLNELLIGEREQIFLKIVQVSFGNEREVRFTCQTCSEQQDVTLLLDTDFPPKVVEDIDVTVLEFTTAKGAVLTYRSATGADQEEVMEKKGATAAEQNSLMLSRCITKRNGGLIPDPLTYARSLPIRDRLKLLDLLVARQPHVELNITTSCASCGAQQLLSMGWGDFFVPNEQALYVNYDVIASNYTGWTLSEIRAMTGRQRNYFLKIVTWKRERARG